MPSILIIPIVALGIIGVVAWLIRRGRKEYQVAARALDAIGSLSIEEAERRALAILRESETFRCTESKPLASAAIESLSGGLKSLLARYECIETIAGPATRIDRSLVRASQLHPGYTVIGKGMAGTDVEFELGARAGEEAVYELYPNEAPDPIFGTYRSVYHWILGTDAEVRKGK